jgi:hypothetical protein
VHTRRGDHRSLILAFFVVLPLQYVLVGTRRFDLFTVFIPVYVFLAIPVVSALAGDPQRFLERNAKIQWGIMVCVYGLSMRRRCCCWTSPLRRARRLPAVLPGRVVVPRRSRRSWPAAGCAGGRWRGRSTAVLVRAWAIGVLARPGGRGAVLDHAVQAGQAAGHGAAWPAAAARWASW